MLIVKIILHHSYYQLLVEQNDSSISRFTICVEVVCLCMCMHRIIFQPFISVGYICITSNERTFYTKIHSVCINHVVPLLRYPEIMLLVCCHCQTCSLMQRHCTRIMRCRRKQGTRFRKIRQAPQLLAFEEKWGTK